MEIKSYRVRLVRPVFQMVVVAVDATSEDDAVLEAVIRADTVPESAWSGEFDPDSYFYDVHSIEEGSESDDGYFSETVEDDRKYLLLRGDIDSGTGALPFQPWLTDVSDLMLVDLCRDWSDELTSLERAGAARFYTTQDRQLKAKHGKTAQVIPFRRPGPSGPGEEPG